MKTYKALHLNDIKEKQSIYDNPSSPTGQVINTFYNVSYELMPGIDFTDDNETYNDLANEFCALYGGYQKTGASVGIDLYNGAALKIDWKKLTNWDHCYARIEFNNGQNLMYRIFNGKEENYFYFESNENNPIQIDDNYNNNTVITGKIDKDPLIVVIDSNITELNIRLSNSVEPDQSEEYNFILKPKQS